MVNFENDNNLTIPKWTKQKVASGVKIAFKKLDSITNIFISCGVIVWNFEKMFHHYNSLVLLKVVNALNQFRNCITIWELSE